MRCPHCKTDGRYKVLETRSNASSIYRRRRCEHCGKTYITVETADAALKMPSEFGRRKSKALAMERLADKEREVFGLKTGHLQQLIVGAITAQ